VEARAGLDGCRKSPWDGSADSESLYRLRYSGPLLYLEQICRRHRRRHHHHHHHHHHELEVLDVVPFLYPSR
jgi:hypothetical protein